MVQRNSRGFFGSLHAFPGGKVDPEDVEAGASEAPRHAAMRELAEEVGFVLASSGCVETPEVKGPDYYRWLREAAVDVDIESLVLVSRWVTPQGAPRRFDTWFFLGTCHDPPRVRIDADELDGFEWVTPGEALERYRSGVWRMFLPTVAHLRWLDRRTSVQDAITSADGADGRTLIEPMMVEDGSLLPIHMPANED